MKLAIVILNLISGMALAGGYLYGDDRTNNVEITKSQIEVREVVQADRVPSEKAGLQLYNISGVTLGKTTADDLNKLGAKKTAQNAYTHAGNKFWLNDKNIVYTINKLTDRPQTWPSAWRSLGLKPSIGYNEAYNLIQDLGFKPVESRAQLDGTMITGKRVLTIKLLFHGSKLTRVTLFAVPRP